MWDAAATGNSKGAGGFRQIASRTCQITVLWGISIAMFYDNNTGTRVNSTTSTLSTSSRSIQRFINQHFISCRNTQRGGWWVGSKTTQLRNLQRILQIEYFHNILSASDKLRSRDCRERLMHLAPHATTAGKFISGLSKTFVLSWPPKARGQLKVFLYFSWSLVLTLALPCYVQSCFRLTYPLDFMCVCVCVCRYLCPCVCENSSVWTRSCVLSHTSSLRPNPCSGAGVVEEVEGVISNIFWKMQKRCTWSE